MKKRLNIVMFVLLLTSLMHSCIHDDLYSASYPANKEYHSKSLWKEDEKYIKNVMTVYQENEEKIKKINGSPLWDYAMTMDRFDESFLMVPVVENGKVTAILNVPRKDQRVYFTYTQVSNDLDFFQNLISDKIKKVLPTEKSNAMAKLVCTTKTISMFYPDDESNPNGSGHWESKRVTECKNQQMDQCMGEVLPDGTCLGGSGTDPGYPYPGGGGEDPQPQPYDPCDKMKAQNKNANYTAKIKALDKPEILKLKKETGYSENKNGTFTELVSSASTNTSDGMTIPVSPSTKGYVHTHTNDYPTGNYNDNGEPEIRQSIKMFSPADVETLMTMAGFITDGNYSEIYGTMISSYGNYTIKFTGTAADIKTGFDAKKWSTEYIEYKKKYDQWSYERLFLTFLKDKMNVQSVELFKIKDNGTIQKKALNSNNKVDSEDCPQ